MATCVESTTATPTSRRRVEDLCLDAKNRYNGEKLANGNPVQAYDCYEGDDYNQEWKVL